MIGKDANRITVAKTTMNENQFEQAQMLDEVARATGIEKARKNLMAKGTLDCIDCGNEIPEKRRNAVPYARRCAGCQTIYERTHKNG